MLDFNATLLAKKNLTDDVVLFTYTRPKKLTFEPGQFLTLKLEKGSRVYSLASSPTQKDTFDLLVKIIPDGLAGTYFTQLQTGDKTRFFGPGGFFTLHKNSKPKIFLATGVGIAPLRSMIHYLTETLFLHDYYLFWGVRKKKDTYLHAEWEQLQKRNNNFKPTFCLSREKILEKRFQKGYVQDVLQLLIKKKRLDSADFDYYVCGLNKNVAAIVEELQEKLAVSPDTLFFERF